MDRRMRNPLDSSALIGTQLLTQLPLLSTPRIIQYATNVSSLLSLARRCTSFPRQYVRLSTGEVRLSDY